LFNAANRIVCASFERWRHSPVLNVRRRDSVEKLTCDFLLVTD